MGDKSTTDAPLLSNPTVVKLRAPITSISPNVTEISMRAPRIGDELSANRRAKGDKSLLTLLLFEAVTEQPRSVIEALEPVDFQRLNGLYLAFEGGQHLPPPETSDAWSSP